MTGNPPACLNCDAALTGAFCSACGQRVMAPYPTLAEMVGDAWQEFTGWDGRFARSFRMLLGRPGRLTLEVLEGRRARYVSPVRLYLVASVAYFLIAALTPHVGAPRTAQLPGRDGVTIDMLDPDGIPLEVQATAARKIARAPWWAQAVLRPVFKDPVKFRRDFLQTLPRVLFVLVPIFAAIVGLFYRGRRFSQHLVFALHLHAAIFTVLAVPELAALTRNPVVIGVAEIATLVFVVAYVLRASRHVYGEPWWPVVLKATGVAAVYLVAGLVGLLVTFAVTAVTG